jgi:thiamine biosynthesis lipoprotein
MKKKPDEVYLVNSHGESVKGVHRFSHEAMATTFEILIQHDEYDYARAASLEAFNEIDRIEQEFSRFVENSDISRLNACLAGEPVQVGPETMECLEIACRLYEDTNHVFDITIGSLFAILLDKDKKPREVSAEEIAEALGRTGADLLELDAEWLTVKVAVEGVSIDLGGVGKGFTIDKIAKLLREWSIDRAMLHGGYSSVLALDAPTGGEGWPVTFSNPLNPKETVVKLFLANVSVSGSGLGEGMHIIDPRTAKPVIDRVASWSYAANAATTDGLSTAFMIMSAEEIKDYCKKHKNARAIVVEQVSADSDKIKLTSYGPWEKGEILA